LELHRSRPEAVNRARLVTAVGACLLVASFAFLAAQIASMASDARAAGVDVSDVRKVLVAAPVYLIAVSLVHIGWGALVCAGAQGEQITLRRATGVALRAQLARYVPGNVMHLAGRQVLAARLGWPQGAAAAATVVELVLLPIVAGGLVLVGAVFIDDVRRIEVGLMPLVALGTAALGLLVGWKLADRWSRASTIKTSLSGMGTAASRVALGYLAFLVLAGCAQWILLQEEPLGRVVVASTVAWVAGYLAPGVPAGLGVREAVLVLLLQLDSGNAAIAVILFRVAMVSSDVILYAIGTLLDQGTRPGGAVPEADTFG
jgi:glycosyltransferase 2 family protein